MPTSPTAFGHWKIQFCQAALNVDLVSLLRPMHGTPRALEHLKTLPAAREQE